MTYHIITGYFKHNVFYASFAPHEEPNFSKKFHQMHEKDLILLIQDTIKDINAGYFNQVPDYGLISIDMFEYRTIKQNDI